MATTQVPAQKSVLWSLPLVRTTAFPWMSYTEIWMGHWLRGHPDPRASPLLTFSPWDNLRGGPVFIAISRRGCLRHRDGKWLSVSKPHREWGNQDSNPGSVSPETMFTTLPYCSCYSRNHMAKIWFLSLPTNFRGGKFYAPDAEQMFTAGMDKWMVVGVTKYGIICGKSLNSPFCALGKWLHSLELQFPDM